MVRNTRYSIHLSNSLYYLGRPCNPEGEFLPDNTPATWEDRDCHDFRPFDSRTSFKLADLLYQKVQMSEANINELLEILAEWAGSLDADADPPFADAKDMYSKIDACHLGDIPWQSFRVSYDGNVKEDDAPWKSKTYDVWFRDPRELLKAQLGNREFANHMDFAPKEVINRKTGARCYQDLMSGQWAWRQADILAEDPNNHGATFCPVILGSDKTTVSVATGQNDYYPLYMSNGLIHNNIRRSHRNGVSLVGLLAIPKSISDVKLHLISTDKLSLSRQRTCW
jgi:hypothetical protein